MPLFVLLASLPCMKKKKTTAEKIVAQAKEADKRLTKCFCYVHFARHLIDSYARSGVVTVVVSPAVRPTHQLPSETRQIA